MRVGPFGDIDIVQGFSLSMPSRSPNPRISFATGGNGKPRSLSRGEAAAQTFDTWEKQTHYTSRHQTAPELKNSWVPVRSGRGSLSDVGPRRFCLYGVVRAG